MPSDAALQGLGYYFCIGMRIDCHDGRHIPARRDC
jgi:hypothetical protein